MDNRNNRVERRKRKVRARIAKEGYRISLFRSNRYLFAQLIDQKTGRTVLGITDKFGLAEKEAKAPKAERAKAFGVSFAKKVLGQKVKEVVFDRGSYLYHGRVKAFVEGMREGGLKV